MRKYLILILGLALILTAAGCDNTPLDVVGNDSVRAFDALVAVQTPAKQANGWLLAAPDGEARLYFHREPDGGQKISLEADVEPFIKAGLRPELLAGGLLSDGRLAWEQPLALAVNVKDADIAEIYRQLIQNHRRLIGYHAALDHYGIDFGDGNMFEWAKDLRTNDKDLVFVLEPAPLLAAGVDPAKLDGWVYGEVEVMDTGGRKLTVFKFLKPFDLI